MNFYCETIVAVEGAVKKCVLLCRKNAIIIVSADRGLICAGDLMTMG